jgi:hypothetical protein
MKRTGVRLGFSEDFSQPVTTFAVDLSILNRDRMF